MRGRWGGSRGSFKFFIQKFYDKINLSSLKTVTAKEDYLDDTKKIEDIQYTDFGGIHTLDSTVQFSKDIVAVPSAAIFTGVNEHTWTVPATATYRAYVCGGGGAGASGSGGHGGLFYADIALIGGEVLDIGVGAGGLATGSIGNSGTYKMRGGTGGSGSVAGAGGGGSYVAFGTSSGIRPYAQIPGFQALTLAAGGGGGSADHSFTANYAGHGFGVGGPAWSTEYANSTYGGKNGFDGNNGAGGTKRTTSGTDGGSASSNQKLVGGNGGEQSNSGGGGGGGAGSGGGGAAGGTAGASTTPGTGGYLFTNNLQPMGYRTEFLPWGGGGGGAHSGNCGACGGGGGSLVYTEYNNSWNSTEGSGIPHWSTSMISTASMSQYAAYSQFNTDCTTYLSATGFGGLVASSAGSRGGPSANGSNGFVAIIPLQTATYTTYT